MKDGSSFTKADLTLYYKRGNTSYNGVGFVVNKDVAWIYRKLPWCFGQSGSAYYQVYLLTTSHTEEAVESIYEDVDELLFMSKGSHATLSGYFNLQIGR